MFGSKSNCKAVNLGLILVLSTLLTSCWKPTKTDSRNPNNPDVQLDSANENFSATFFVPTVDGKASPPEIQAGALGMMKWAVPNSRTYSFRACVKDRMTKQDLLGHRFRVEAQNQLFANLISDGSGCIIWTETFSYNYWGTPKYLILDRKVVGEGIHSGNYNICFAINPWASSRGEKSEDAVDCNRYKNFAKGQTAKGADNIRTALAGATTLRRQLYMSGVQIHILQAEAPDPQKQDSKDDQKNVGIGLKYAIEMTPQVQWEDTTGNVFTTDLNTGKYRISAMLVLNGAGQSGNTKVLLTPNIPPEYSGVQKTIRADFHFALGPLLQNGNLELALKVEPVDGAPSELASFEAIYEVGGYFEILGKKSPTLKLEVHKNLKSFKLEDYLAKTVNYQKLIETREMRTAEKVEFGTMTLRAIGVQPGETATTRTINYQASVCAVNNPSRREVREAFWIYKDGRKEPDIIEPDMSGCFRWIHNITHKYYHPENLFFRKVTFKKKVSEKPQDSSFEKTLELVINPWDLGFTFGYDRAAWDPKSIDNIINRPKKASEFYVPGFNYQTTRVHYEVDPFLELEVKKQVLLRVDPFALRYNSIFQGRRQTEKIRDGIYLMKVAVQKYYLDPATPNLKLEPNRMFLNGQSSLGELDPNFRREFVTAIKKLVRIQDGHTVTPVEFSVRDLKLMRIRSNMLISFQTVDETLLQLAVYKTVAPKDYSDFLQKVELTDEQKSQLALIEKDINTQIKSYRKENLDKLAQDFNAFRAERDQATLGKAPLNSSALMDAYRAAKNANSGKTKIPKSTDALSLYPERLRKLIEPMDMGSDMRKIIETNDFMKIPAAPIVNLDLLVDRDSGLAERTFVGPIILISNNFTSSVRPTDNLDEIYCTYVDCDQIKAELKKREVEDPDEYQESKNANLESYYNSISNSRYFGNTDFLKKAKVDTYIQEMAKLEREYQFAGKKHSLIHNFVSLYGLDFVSLNGKEKLKKFIPGCKNAVFENCLEETKDNYVPSETFFSDLVHSYTRGQKTESDFRTTLTQFLHRQKGVENQAADQLCGYFTYRLFGWPTTKQSESFKAQNRFAPEEHPKVARFLSECRSKAKNGFGEVFAYDPKVRINKFNPRVRYKIGNSINIQLNADVRIAHNLSFDYNVGIRPLSTIGLLGTGLAAIGFVATKIPHPIIWVMGATATASSAINWNNGRTEGRNATESQSVSQSTMLVVQEAIIDIQMREYEMCAAVTFTNEFAQFATKILADLPSEKMSRFRGLFLCSGNVIKKPEPIRERYYYFAQFFAEADMLDMGDLYSHPWLLSIRGLRDYRAFLALAEAGISGVEKNTVGGKMNQIWNKDGLYSYATVRKQENWPIHQLASTYLNVLPSFPRLHSKIEDAEEIPNYPWNDLPSDSFKEPKEAPAAAAPGKPKGTIKKK